MPSIISQIKGLEKTSRSHGKVMQWQKLNIANNKKSWEKNWHWQKDKKMYALNTT